MSALARVWRGLRVVLGVGLITLVLLVLVIEAGYAAYHVARRAAWGHRPIFDSAQHPFWDEPWFAGWLHRMNGLAVLVVYDPYRGWRLRPYASAEVNVDSAGVRATVHPPGTPHRSRRLLLLGGSTMWGFSARDSFTIPSLVAARLAAQGVDDVEVVNLASIGYNVTQSANTLLLEVRSGSIPAAVVSLDGINEVGVVEAGGEPGEVYLQDRAESHFDRSSFWGDVAYLRYHLSGTIRAEAVVRHVLGLQPRPPETSSEVLCARVASNYTTVTRAMEALGREFGFPLFFTTTPTLARSGKPRTPWEKSLENGFGRLRELTVRCAIATDSLMADRRGKTFFPLDSIFDRDTASVFIDHYGHVTEAANGVIADRIAALVLPALRREEAP